MTTELLDPKTKAKLKSIPPRFQIKPSLSEKISGNRYDIVLACQPDARDHYPLYRGIVSFVEDEKKMRIYSPHSDMERKGKMKDVLRFTITEAIPRTRAVIVHLTTITPEIKKMFESTYKNSRPFLLFYHKETSPFSQESARNILAHHCYRGQFEYFSEKNAVNLLDWHIDKLVREN